jgi:hypothetical protein
MGSRGPAPSVTEMSDETDTSRYIEMYEVYNANPTLSRETRPGSPNDS